MDFYISMDELITEVEPLSDSCEVSMGDYLTPFQDNKFHLVVTESVYATITTSRVGDQIALGGELHKEIASRVSAMENVNEERILKSFGDNIAVFLSLRPMLVNTKRPFKRFGTGKEKLPNRVVFLRPKKRKLLPSERRIKDKIFKYSHKFSVSGHWRKVSGLGKNQSGEYIEVGRTWVIDCVKGQGDYIYKPRVVRRV